MRVFHCDHCRHLLFFENTFCVKCGHTLAFLPDLMLVASLDQCEGTEREWTSPLTAAAGRTYRLCENYQTQSVCNWAVDIEDDDQFCLSCRLTRVIPDLTVPGSQAAWYRLETAKRRLLYTLLELNLPYGAAGDTPPLTFRFMANPAPGEAPVMTGHADGVITLNVSEADDAERERRRHALGEPYRTLLGHLRHESGHYFWMRLVSADEARLSRFREAFGDERQDYGEALQRHYDAGPAPSWQDQYVSAYASAHPWEDWAETWAHYLHMTDTLETAATCGVSMHPARAGEPSLRTFPGDATAHEASFDQLMDAWFPVTYLLNNLNRGLGQADPYPFVLSAAAEEKLQFVHDIARHVGAAF